MSDQASGLSPFPPSDTRHVSATKGVDLRIVAALVGLVLVATPTLSQFNEGLGPLTAATAALFSLLPVLTRAHLVPRLALSLAALTLVYGFGAVFSSYDSGQGFRHAIATATASATILLFATFGEDIANFGWFRGCSYVLIAAGVVSVNTAGMPKNIAGGTTIYLLVLATSLLIFQKPNRAWLYSGVFVATSITLAIVLDFRSLAGYVLVFTLGLLGATMLSGRSFWWAGLFGSITAIWGVSWYFLNAHTNVVAIDISRRILEQSGRPPTSGRDWLWPAIQDAVAQQPWFGLGVDILPRNILATELSSHSSYMQVYLQLGVIGLVLVAMALLAIWKPLAFSVSVSGRFGSAVFLMFVCHNAMEVLMFQNSLDAGIPAWCAIGLAYSVARSGTTVDGARKLVSFDGEK